MTDNDLDIPTFALPAAAMAAPVSPFPPRTREGRGFRGVTSQIAAYADLNALLAPTGWALVDVSINTETGFARVVAERRDTSAGTGIKVTLLRSMQGSKVVEKRDVIERRLGMYRDFWEVTDASFGGRRFDGMRSALRCLARYIDDNVQQGRLADTTLRQLAASFA